MVHTLKRSANWKWMAYWTRILPFWSESENVIYRQVVERSNCDDKGRSFYKKIGSAKWNFHVFDVIFFFSLVIEGERPLLNQLTYSRPWRFTSREKESNIRDLNRLWSAWFELAWNFCFGYLMSRFWGCKAGWTHEAWKFLLHSVLTASDKIRWTTKYEIKPKFNLKVLKINK